MVTLSRAVDYIVANAIPGDMVRCGVAANGSCMTTAALTLRAASRQRGSHALALRHF